MSKAIIVADSSALIALAAIDALAILTQLFENVLVPDSVYAETTIEGKPYAAVLGSFLADKTIRSDSKKFIDRFNGLGPGETDAISLALSKEGAIVLTDDKKARKYANLAGLGVTGSIAILIVAKKKGMIESVKEKILLLRQKGFWLSDLLIHQALKQAGEE